MRFACLAFAGMLHAFAQSNPPLISYATYLGAASSATSIAVDPAGYAYVAGVTHSPQSTCTMSLGPQSSSSPSAFLTKIQPRGDGVVWTACLPGSSGAVALDVGGSIYFAVSGTGSSTIMKLAPADLRVISTRSIAAAAVSAIAVDAAGNIYATGAAGDGLPVTTQAFEPRFRYQCSAGSTCSAGFVVKISAFGAILYATYTGTSGRANAIAVDSQARVWITGQTNTSTSTGARSFIAKFDAAGSQRLVHKAFGGGRASQFARYAAGAGIVVDARDAAYAVGFAELSIETTPGTLQPRRESPYRRLGYAMKLDAAGNTLYSTYVGVPGSEGEPSSSAESIAIDAAGRAYIALKGYAEVPNCSAGQSTLLVLSADASRLIASRVLKGSAGAIALDADGAVYMAGATTVTSFFATPDAYLTQYPGGSNSAIAAKVDFSQPAPAQLNCIVNAASFRPGRNSLGEDGSVAPGEIVTLWGEGFLPDLSVTFDGVPAPILYSDTGQINAVVPFQTGSRNPYTLVVVRSGTQVIRGFKLPVADAAPGLFTIAGLQLAALNQDGSVNSSANPAAPGSVVSIFMTGAGRYDMGIGDGEPGPLMPPFPTPVLGISAAIWSPVRSSSGRPAPVLFAGQAPGLIAGVVQVNLQLPVDTLPGKAGIVVYVGNYSTVLPLLIDVR